MSARGNDRGHHPDPADRDHDRRALRLNIDKLGEKLDSMKEQAMEQSGEIKAAAALDGAAGAARRS